MSKKIAAVGVNIPGDDSAYISFLSKNSLLDYDISVFDPNIEFFYEYRENYRGKPCLDDSNSFRLKEILEHWGQEILGAIKAVKTVFVLLNSLQEVHVATGEVTYSGTGRNQKGTRHVDILSH